MAMVEANEHRELVNYAASSIDESRDMAHGDLGRRLRSGGRAALVMDGYANPDLASRTEAVIIELFGQGAQPIGMIIQPYRAARRSRLPVFGRSSSFAVLGEPLLSEDIDTDGAETLIQEGIQDHPKGKALFDAREPFDARRY